MSEIEVHVAALLHSYTGGRRVVHAAGDTLGEVFADLDRRFPGMRFRVIDEQDRIRRHMRIFVGMDEPRDVRRPLAPGDELMIFGALSGG